MTLELNTEAPSEERRAAMHREEHMKRLHDHGMNTLAHIEDQLRGNPSFGFTDQSYQEISQIKAEADHIEAALETAAHIKSPAARATAEALIDIQHVRLGGMEPNEAVDKIHTRFRNPQLAVFRIEEGTSAVANSFAAIGEFEPAYEFLQGVTSPVLHQETRAQILVHEIQASNLSNFVAFLSQPRIGKQNRIIVSQAAIRELSNQGHFEEAKDLARMLDTDVRQDIVIYIAQKEAEAGEFETAARTAEHPREIPTRAHALARVGRVAARLGRPDWEEYLEQAIQLANRRQIPRVRINALLRFANEVGRIDQITDDAVELGLYDQAFSAANEVEPYLLRCDMWQKIAVAQGTNGFMDQFYSTFTNNIFYDRLRIIQSLTELADAQLPYTFQTGAELVQEAEHRFITTTPSPFQEYSYRPQQSAITNLATVKMVVNPETALDPKLATRIREYDREEVQKKVLTGAIERARKVIQASMSPSPGEM